MKANFGKPGESTRQSGFTLIEVLLAASLMSILVVLYGGSITQSIRVRDKVRDAVRSFESLQGLVVRLEADLRGMYIESISNDHSVTATRFQLINEFDGDSPIDTLQFTTFVNLSNQGLFQNVGDGNSFMHAELAYEFEFDKETETYTLFRREDLGMDLEPEDGGLSFVLVRNLRGLDVLAYDSQTKSWEENWDSRDKNNRLPTALQLVVWYGGDENKDSWRPLVKTLFIESTTGGDLRSAAGATTDTQ